MNALDLIRPDVYWIRDRYGERCYRRNVPSFSTGSVEERQITPIADGTGECTAPRLAACGVYYDGDEPPCGEAEEVDDDYEIVYDEKFDNFYTKISIAKEYYKHIIGRQAETKKRLESQTKTRIDVPKIGFEDDVVIKGSSRDAVASCRRRIEMLVDSARQRQPFTHFISLPFNADEIIGSFCTFKRLVLERCAECRGVDESIFQIPERLHLTVGMLVLFSNNERTLAKETLEQCKIDIITPHLAAIQSPLRVRLKGLNYMNDDPSDVHVLYGKVELMDELDSDVLQNLTNKIVDYFVQKNVMPKKQYDAVKLHVTLMNTRYRVKGDGDEGESAAPSNGNGFGRGGFYGRNGENRSVDTFEKRESFDARTIFEEFRDFDFGVQVLKEVHLSQRHVRAEGGYYPCTAKIDIY